MVFLLLQTSCKREMRIVRFITFTLFGICLSLWLLTGVIAERNADKQSPIITAESDEIRVSVKDDVEKLLEGLSASDNRDGDLTNEIMVGNRSKFSSPGVLDMTYLVFDSSNNVGQYTRKVEYTDYDSPRFNLSGPLTFGIDENISILNRLKLIDSIDGDISDKIKIVSSDIDITKAGLYKVGVEGTNAYGDTVMAEMPVNVVEKRTFASQLLLKKYLVYLEKNEAFNPEKYLDKVVLADGREIHDMHTVSIDNQVNTTKPGCYNVLYSYPDANGYTIYTSMVVIVLE